MSLAALLLEQQSPKGPNCSVGLFLETLNAVDRAEWDEVLGNLRIQSTTIARHAETIDAGMKADAIRRHRNGQCRCPKS